MPVETVEKVLELYREKYFGLNVRHFHEKLVEEHQIELSYTWVKRALQGAGLVAKGRKRGTLAGCRVTVCEHLDSRLSVHYGPHAVGRYNSAGEPLPPGVRKPGRKRKAA